MFNFNKKQKTDFRNSDVWMATLQDREEKKLVINEPVILEHAIPVQLEEIPESDSIGAEPKVIENGEHVIVTRDDLEASNDEQKLRSLQEEIADLPDIMNLALA
jgi:hypothetical protein